MYGDHKQEIRWLDPTSGSPFARLWFAGKADACPVQPAAAALAVGGSANAEALRILESAEVGESQQKQVDLARTWAYAESERMDELDALVTRYQGTIWESEFRMARIAGLAQQKDVDGIEAAVRSLRGRDRRLVGRMLLAGAATLDGQLDRAHIVLDELRAEAAKLPPDFRSRVSELYFFQKSVPDEALRLAKDSFQEGHAAYGFEQLEELKSLFPAYLLTLCEEGQVAQAAELLRSIPATEPQARPVGMDFYVQGRIAEKCGFEQHARERYGRIPVPGKHNPEIPYVLAQHRLQRWSPSAVTPDADARPNSLQFQLATQCER